MVKTIIVVLIAVLVPSIVGLVIYKMYLVPAITGGEKPAEGKTEEAKHETGAKEAHKSGGEKAGAEEPADDTPISPESVPFDLPEEQITVKTGPDEPQAVLVYSCAVVCANEEVKVLVEKNKQWFIATLGELHRNRTMAELNNTEVQKTILAQGKEQCNSIVRRFEAEDKKKKKKEGEAEEGIIAVLHTKWAIFTL